MQSRYCTGCGRPLAQGMKICPNCGHVTQNNTPRSGRRQPSRQPQRTGRPAGTARPSRTAQPKRTARTSYAPPPPPPSYYQPPPADVSRQSAAPKKVKKRKSSGSRLAPAQAAAEKLRRKLDPETYLNDDELSEEQKRRSAAVARTMNRVFKLVRAALIIAVIYVVIFAVQVFRVKTASYPFKSDMKMTYKNYGQAMGQYFEDDKWSVNPFTGTCTFKGTSRHSEEYEIVFTVRLKVNIKEITIDGKPVEKKYFETKAMGMFI